MTPTTVPNISPYPCGSVAGSAEKPDRATMYMHNSHSAPAVAPRSPATARAMAEFTSDLRST